MNRAAQRLGRRGGLKGGKSTSPAKVKAAQENGKSGGRPKKNAVGVCSIRHLSTGV